MRMNNEHANCIIKFPSMTDQNGWIDFVSEARKYYPEATPLGFRKDGDFKTWLDDLIRLNIGSNLKEGETPSSTFFLCEGTKILGYLTIKRKNLNLDNVGQIYLNIRPSARKMGYGDKLLKMGLTKCREINLKQVIISVPEESIGGQKLMQKNGGVLTETKDLNGSGIKMNIYTIKL